MCTLGMVVGKGRGRRGDVRKKGRRGEGGEM